MKCNRSFPSSIRGFDPAAGSRGTTLAEVLVSMLLLSVVLAVALGDFSFLVRTRFQAESLLEVEQGLDAGLSEVSRHLRQAGACLGSAGKFIALNGRNDLDGTGRDRLWIRVGKVDPDTLICVTTALADNASKNATSIRVLDATGFQKDDLLYIRRGQGGGTIFEIASVDQSTGTITLETGLNRNYFANDSVWAIEERLYRVFEDTSGRPVLRVRVNRDQWFDLVDGANVFDLQYILDDGSTVPLPAKNAQVNEWPLVRQLELEMQVVSPDVPAGQQPVQKTRRSRVRPRNLL